MNLHFDYIWIPSSLGGHSTLPYEGMRTTIRWQRHLSEFLLCARDIQWIEFSFDPATPQGKARCKFTTDDPPSEGWLREGELIELLSGFRVLAIGRITNL